MTAEVNAPLTLRRRAFLLLFPILRKFRPYLAPGILKLSPNTVLKYGKVKRLAEASTLEFVASKTNIPIPRVIDAFQGPNEIKYILMTFIKGEPLERCWSRLSETEQKSILHELKGYMEALRAIPPPEPEIVASTDLSPCHDDRIASDDFGPFSNHEDFHRFLRWGHGEESPNTKLAEIYKAQNSRKYRSVLTHCDLAPRNIIVDNGKVAGIIDWELAGWFPEYWEYTRAWESMWDMAENRDLLREWLDPYPDELRTETMRLDILR